ncbi:MBL fold metallo-hydrolase [Virgibacillus pantothenticus]|uniref:Metallo-beta-lactamase family protein n=2 Tax=Bacillaceae TaxID=186817 RepID=A0A0L0QKR9_VIRPA|nr:MBL fold metallo-hydrolase [Virgibacillus sp. 6R]KNE18868.1 metallo-beta-lactamase family protein [Virgibacillus pantothenticus]MBS7428411.1 MBL fold metallo-hydrolase [Virgibacillus sp. 19R1-5]MBU8565156.1 MBL fold metallo-hydrolase [Virgibacillus pantothenticus]MBU8601440.1 MBL fold metallo-hydrolase [Virgibacillus pantothenticus]
MKVEQGFHKREHDRFIPMTSITSGGGVQVKSDVYYYTDQMVNIGFIGYPEKGDWVLVDAGLPHAAPEIKSVVVDRFGKGSKPAAILLTHAHFDHVGGLADLIEEWDVPIYAHPKELPYVRGEKSYPKPDSSVEGGLLAKIADLYPNEPIDLGNAVQALPEDHQVPHLDGWKWIHTPGHTPGHVSFYRESDRLLFSGDAFITVRQDSFYRVLMQSAEVNGPPRYFTTNWDEAYESVRKLAKLEPRVVVSGHGVSMKGEKLTKGLNKLVEHFTDIAVPDHGEYVDKGNNLYH